MFVERVSKLGLDPQKLYMEAIAGFPAYYKAQGISPDVVKRMLFTAEDLVERDLDILISPRMVYCVQDQTFEPAESDAIVLPPLDIPANWFAGNRQGGVKLPKGFPRKIVSLKITTSYFTNQQRNIPVNGLNSPVKLDKNLLRLSHLNNAGGLGLGFAGAGSGFGAGGIYRHSAGSVIAGGLEVVYECGLTRQQIENDFYPIMSMIPIQMQIGIFTELQHRVGGNGAQEEALVQDAMSNTIKYPDRSKAGVFGGEIAMLRKQYDALKNAMNSGVLKFMVLQ